MDVIALLKKDHEKIAALLDKLEDTTERAEKTRDELFRQLKDELDAHSHIEERFFYPVLKQADETRDITLEGVEEHRIIKRLLGELEASAKDSEQWTAKMAVLKESVEHHVEEEEGDMFKKAAKVLDAEQRKELGEKMAAAKAA